MTESTRVRVGPVTEFKDKSRQLIKCGDRNIAVYRYKDKFYALDNACYHHGGPLIEGDIEDMGGHPCIVCPWHQYHITLDTGEGLYWALQLSSSGIPDKNAPQTVRSKGRKQRTHIVTIENGDIFVTVDTSEPTLDSDVYAEMPIANQEQTMSHPVSTGGLNRNLHSGIRSGQVLAGMAAKKRTFTFGSADYRVVACVRAERICEDTKEFYFNLCQGKLETPIYPGQFVDLQLPIASASGKPFMRRWTIMETNKSGCLFTLIIKAAEQSRGGSAWMLENGVHQRFPLLLIGGNFTLSHHMDRLREVKGRIVVLSAGIGLTAPYASLRKYIDGIPEIGIPKLQVIHLHVEKTASFLFGEENFVRWHNSNANHFTYRFHCYLTRQLSNNLMNESLKNITTCGRRPNEEDIKDFVQYFIGTSPVIAFVCGPPSFIRMGKTVLASLGVLNTDMLTDEDYEHTV